MEGSARLPCLPIAVLRNQLLEPPGGCVARPLFVVALLAAAALVGFRYGWIRVNGLSGSCTQVSANADGSVVEACSRGRLAGWPGLEKHGCTYTEESGRWQYWHCPAPLEASQAGR